MDIAGEPPDITIWSDFIWPFCRIAEPRALWLERQFGARITWLPFHLHPEYPPAGIPRAELEARYGPGSQDRIRTWFEDEGLTYAPPADIVSSTRLALELGEGAREEGLHRAYHDRVMDAYWAEGQDLSLRPVLEELARGVGMSDDGIARALDDRAWAPVVDASTARAQAAGVTGVPAFVIDWRVLVMGAQPREVLAQAIAQARVARTP
jgi:predicted DsbA family dithiol-disulfide isomerase